MRINDSVAIADSAMLLHRSWTLTDAQLDKVAKPGAIIMSTTLRLRPAICARLRAECNQIISIAVVIAQMP